MKQDYTMYIYKADKRTKSGERRVSTTVWRDRGAEAMANEVRGLALPYPAQQGYRIEVVASMKTVTNLITGLPVSIPHDTPRSCDPSCELFWSL